MSNGSGINSIEYGSNGKIRLVMSSESSSEHHLRAHNFSSKCFVLDRHLHSLIRPPSVLSVTNYCSILTHGTGTSNIVYVFYGVLLKNCGNLNEQLNQIIWLFLCVLSYTFVSIQPLHKKPCNYHLETWRK